MNRTIMGIGAHADDVEIYFGGTLLKYMDRGYDIVYVQSTNNMSGGIRREQSDGSWQKVRYDPTTTMQFRKAECDAAAAEFDTTPVHLDHAQRHYHRADGTRLTLHFTADPPEDVPMDRPTILTAHEDPQSVQRLAALILEHDPEAIFTHGFAEVNPEHTTTALLVSRAYRQAVAAGYRGHLLHAVNRFADEVGAFNCQWETWVDITGYVDRRMAAIQKHASQYPPDFDQGARFWRPILAARGRACGVDAAEIFNFISPAEPAPDQGELLDELLRNRAAPGAAWSLAHAETTA